MFKKKYLPVLLVLVFGLVELINNFLINYFEEAQPYSFVYKVFIVVLLLFLNRKYYSQHLLMFFLLFLIFLCSQIFTIQFEFGYIKNFGLFFKYIYVLLLVIGLKPLMNTVNYTIIKDAFQLLFTIFLIFILVSFIFNIEAFSTYQGQRFGFKGLLNKSSDLTYFLCLGIISSEILKFRYQKCFIFALALAILISGTKASLLFLILYSLHFFNKIKLDYKSLLIYAFSTFLFIFLVFKFFNKKIESTFQIFSNLYNDEGLISAITSFRSRKLIELSSAYYEEWNYINYLFGGKTAYYLHTEFDIVDVLMFFGVIGGTYYLFHIYRVVFKNILKNNRYLIILLLFIACLVGQFFYNTLVAVLIAFLVNLEAVQKNQEKSKFTNQ